jgi:hypothetical protein
MERFMKKRKHRKLSRHTYDIADFGLTEDQIQRFMAGADDVPALAAA